MRIVVIDFMGLDGVVRGGPHADTHGDFADGGRSRAYLNVDTFGAAVRHPVRS
jgi:hypothetical protein